MVLMQSKQYVHLYAAEDNNANNDATLLMVFSAADGKDANVGTGLAAEATVMLMMLMIMLYDDMSMLHRGT